MRCTLIQLVGQQLLQLGILGLQLPQAFRLVHLEPGVLAPPVVEGARRDAELPADVIPDFWDPVVRRRSATKPGPVSGCSTIPLILKGDAFDLQ